MIGFSWRAWRDKRTLQRRPIPDALWSTTLARFPFLARLDSADATRLRDMSTLFLARKEFTGVHGLSVTDGMAVAVAAQACLPVLNLGLDWYDGFVGVVMHPSEMLARRAATDEDGVVHEYDETLSGEAVDGGPVTLSWQDVAESGQSAAWGYNVVIHEFAHVLDMRDGHADGAPPLPDRALRDEWHSTFEANYNAFCRQVDAGVETWLDPYGAEAPAEFFAVTCEAFFVAPQQLRATYPYLYALLQRFFRQDPVALAA